MAKRRHSSFDSNPGCAVEAAISLVDGKWKCVALWYLHDRGTVRFNELMRLMDGVTQRTLTNQLRELEGDGMINRVVHAEVPLRVEYSLSDRGRSFVPILLSLSDWGEANMDLFHRSGTAAL